MAILTHSGRVVMAESVKARPIYLAWGTGDPAWDTTPVTPSITDTALVAEVGRRIATKVAYCTPNDAGEIVTGSGRFTESLTPTNHLYMRFNYDFADSPAAEIREFAVFVGSTTDPALPIGQMYFSPAQVVTPGLMLVTERKPKFDRSGDVRESFEFVVTF